MDCRLEEKKSQHNLLYKERAQALALGVLCVQKYLGNVSRQVRILVTFSFGC